MNNRTKVAKHHTPGDIFMCVTNVSLNGIDFTRKIGVYISYCTCADGHCNYHLIFIDGTNHLIHSEDIEML